MKKHALLSLIVSLCSLAVFGVMLAFQIEKSHDDFEESITVKSGESTSETLEFKALSLIPGESVEYTISLKSDLVSNYLITLEFDETEDLGLKAFVDAVVSIGGTELYRGTLTDLFAGDPLSFEYEIKEEAQEISIVYSMDREVGDSAQGAECKFDVLFTAETA
ncbi:MAG: hypothetical protein J6C93_05820 [Clostridia bacterium]|nr:hypothetical protein [Clostridia bacterium]